MKHKNLWCSLILGFMFTFCFGSNVFAATSYTSMNQTINTGETLTIRGQSYTGLDPENVFNYTGGQTGSTYMCSWKLSENLAIMNLSKNKYYTGFLYVRLRFTLPIDGMEISQVTIEDNEQTEGLKFYVGSVTSNVLQIGIVFDNYYTSNVNMIGTPTINITINKELAAPTSQNFPLSIEMVSSNLSSYDMVQNNGLTAMIWSAINQGVGSQLDSALSLLTDIRNQDYTYYVQLTSDISQIITNQANSYQALLDIIDELDTDFEEVQTVLDLFPSYRLQVLQYWQEFLQMNAAQSSEAAEQESKYADGESQANDMVSNMEAVGLPSISNGDLDILGSIDGTQKNNFFGVIALITHTEIVTKIMLIIVIGAMVGFIMYGKKGG